VPADRQPLQQADEFAERRPYGPDAHLLVGYGPEALGALSDVRGRVGVGVGVGVGARQVLRERAGARILHLCEQLLALCGVVEACVLHGDRGRRLPS
jgi:hypothetical protein